MMTDSPGSLNYADRELPRTAQRDLQRVARVPPGYMVAFGGGFCNLRVRRNDTTQGRAPRRRFGAGRKEGAGRWNVRRLPQMGLFASRLINAGSRRGVNLPRPGWP